MVLVQSVTVDPKICQNYDFQNPKLAHFLKKIEWDWSNKRVWKIFFQDFKRVWRKMSEYEGKKIQLSKRVYSFIRDLRVPSIWGIGYLLVLNWF